jgi:predicted DNA-binding protein
MPTQKFTIRLPSGQKRRLRALAKSRGLSVNKLIEEMSAQAIAVWDTETRFRAMAAKGDVKRALALLDGLDAKASSSKS